MRLYTSRYQNKEGIIASGALPVAISNGLPRFKTRYDFVVAKAFAPDWWTVKQSRSDPDWGLENFDRLYREKLDRLRIGEAHDILLNLAHTAGQREGDENLVLLCYEKIGERCHRHVFADWWKQHTGWLVRELPDKQAVTEALSLDL